MQNFVKFHLFCSQDLDRKRNSNIKQGPVTLLQVCEN